MALFPLHTWLPNAYAEAPHPVRAMLGPLATKVSVFVLIRMMVSVFSVEYLWSLEWGRVLVVVSCVAIIAGSLFALAQKDFARMLTYLIIAEVGYMMGGVWLGNTTGLIGAAFHVLADALMTVCLFLAAGNFAQAGGIRSLADFKDAFVKMPFSMAAFTIAAMSMIGVPPTCGFFSKWYLIIGGIQAGRLFFVFCLLFSSLVNVVLFFRIFEHAFFGGGHDHEHTHDNHGSEHVIQEASLPMVGTLFLAALSLLVLGWYSKFVIEHFVVSGLGV
jgi:multicomponent Na+:H+ antiporter subunit D